MFTTPRVGCLLPVLTVLKKSFTAFSGPTSMEAKVFIMLTGTYVALLKIGEAWGSSTNIHKNLSALPKWIIQALEENEAYKVLLEELHPL